MLGVTYIELKVVLVAEVDAVYPWRIQAVTFSIFTLVILQVAVAVNIVHEASLVVFRYETEFTLFYLCIGWDVDSIVVVTVAVHIVGGHERVVVTATPCFIYQAIVVVTLVVSSY